MSVAAAVPPLVLAALLWFLPGWVVGEAMRLPRRLLPILAPVLGIGVLSVVGQWSTLVGTGWSPLVAAVGVALVVGTVVVVRSVARRRSAGRTAAGPRDAGRSPGVTVASDRLGWSVRRSALPGFGYRGRDLAWIAVPSAVGGALAGWAWWRGTSRLAGIHQDYDMPIHANLVRLTAETRTWDPGLAGLLNYYATTVSDAPNASYPIGFHAVAALGWGASGLAVPTWLDVVVLMLLLVQLPLSAVALTLLLTRRPVALGMAGLVSGMVTMYPFENLFRGPLLAFTAGMLLVGPAALVVVMAVQHRRWSWAPVAAAAVFGVFAVQPAALVVLAFVLVPAFLAELARAGSRRAVGGQLLHATGAAALFAVVGLPTLALMARQADRVGDVRWVPTDTVDGAITNVLLFQHAVREPQLVLTVGLVLGLVVLVHLRQSWYLVPWLLSAALFVYLDGTPDNDLAFITGLFYGDAWRFSAMAAMFAVPIVALGLWGVSAWVADLVAGRRPHRPLAAAPVRTVAVVTATVVVVVPAGYVARNAELTSANRPVVGTVLSPPEHDLLSRIDDWVAPGDNVLNQACDGSTWMYALGGRTPMIRNYETLLTRDQELLFTAFDEIDERPDVVAAAARMNIRWVYVAENYIIPRDMPAAGVRELDEVEALTLVEDVGEARLYRVEWDRVPGGAEALAEAAGTQLGLEGVPGMWGTTEPQPITADRLTCTW